MAHRILRLPEVKARTGLSRSTIYCAVAGGTFVAPIKLSPHCVGWLEEDIEQWIDERVAAARKSVPQPHPKSTS